MFGGPWVKLFVLIFPSAVPMALPQSAEPGTTGTAEPARLLLMWLFQQAVFFLLLLDPETHSTKLPLGVWSGFAQFKPEMIWGLLFVTQPCTARTAALAVCTWFHHHVKVLLCARPFLASSSSIYQSWWWFPSENAESHPVPSPLRFLSECLFCAKTVWLPRAPARQKGEWAQLCLEDMSRQETVEQCLYHIHSILLPAAQKAKCFCTPSPWAGTAAITYHCSQVVSSGCAVPPSLLLLSWRLLMSVAQVLWFATCRPNLWHSGTLDKMLQCSGSWGTRVIWTLFTQSWGLLWQEFLHTPLLMHIVLPGAVCLSS